MLQRNGGEVSSDNTEHAWKHHQHIEWQGTRVTEQARRPKELQLKEALQLDGELLNLNITNPMSIFSLLILHY